MENRGLNVQLTAKIPGFTLLFYIGVSIPDNIEHYDYGKFVRILDPGGNMIGLWEPVDSALTKMNSSINNRNRSPYCFFTCPKNSMIYKQGK